MFIRLVLPFVFLALAVAGHARAMDPMWTHDVYAVREHNLDLVYVDVEDAVPSAFPALAREATRILAGVGVNARWRPGGHGAVAEDHELTVVLMNESGRRLHVASHILGATILNGSSVRTVWIYLPHVASVLGLDPAHPAGRKEEDAALLGTALGRVAAHEILHALAPTLPHSLSGLMAERLGRPALTGPVIEVPATFRQALHPGLLRRASVD
jgi:hypothetical protein